MAAVTCVEIGGGGKLSRVPILMAIGAGIELQTIQSIFAFWDMALGTLNPRVTACERVLRGSVFFHREQRRLPPLYLVAGRALTAIGSFGELAVMRVLMAVGALLKGEWFFEIAIRVTLSAIHGSVPALERILRLRVVKALIDVLERDLLPSGCAMARRASLREAAVVRIFVAVGAKVERNSDVLRFSLRTVGMALGALHLRVLPRQWIAGLAVIELADVNLLPVDEVVA